MAKDPRKEALETVVVVQDALQSISDSIAGTLEDALGTVKTVSESTIKDIEKGFKDLSKVGRLLSDAYEKAGQGALTQAQVDKTIIDRRSKILALEASIDVAKRNNADLSAKITAENQKIGELSDKQIEQLIKMEESRDKQAEAIKQQEDNLERVKAQEEAITEELQKQLDRSRNISGAMGFTGDILGGMEKTLSKFGISGMSEEFAKGRSEATKLANQLTEDGARGALLGEKFRIAFAGVGTALQAVIARLMGPLGLILLLTRAFKTLVNINKQTVELGKQMALTAKQARAFRFELSAAALESDNVLVNTKSLVEAQGQLAKAFSAARGFTMKQREDQVLLTKNIGLQVESAGKLQQLAALNSESAKEASDAIIKQNTAFGNQTGIIFDNREILEEVANASAEFSANLDNNPAAIGKAVVEMRRLGLNLENAVSMSKALLDFESSIEAELEAELLTGRELNFERARALALQGKFAESAAEVANQVGTLADFQNASVIEQEALAKAANMTTEELANSLMMRENLANLGEEERKRVQETINELMAQGKVDEANALARAATSDEEAIKATERLDAQQKMNAAIEKMSVAMGDILGHLEPMITGFANMVEYIANSKTAVAILTGVVVGLGVALAAAAISAIAASSALTLGIGAAAIGAGIFAAGAAMTSMMSNAKDSVGHGVIDPEGKIISTDPADFLIAHTDPDQITSEIAGRTAGTGGDMGIMKELVSELKGLRSDVAAGRDINIDGNAMGKYLSLAAHKSTTA